MTVVLHPIPFYMLALNDMGYNQEIDIDYIARISQEVPCVSNTKPVGEYYLPDLEEQVGCLHYECHSRGSGWITNHYIRENHSRDL